MGQEIDHIGIKVSSVKESVDWYVDNYKCEIIHQDDDWAFLQFNNIKLALFLPGTHPNHIAFRVDNESDLDTLGKKKKHRDGTSSCYTAGPGGEIIEYIFYPEEK